MIYPSIKSVEVLGLHDQFKFSLELNPTLNIIYGKNGKGKTTLLHILANALELDFERFASLRFREINIRNHGGNLLNIKRQAGPDGVRILVEIDGTPTTIVSSESDLSGIERSAIREYFGPKAVYLPAFRAILERFGRGDAIPRSPELATRSEYKKIVASENEHLITLRKGNSYLDFYSDRFSQSESTAFKTIQCREWFGATVPIVRYPSLIEIASQLLSEWRFARFQMIKAEEEMFSESFARVFESILSSTPAGQNANFQSLLDSLSSTIPNLQTPGSASNKVFDRISKAVVQIKPDVSVNDEQTAKKVLSLYVDLMQKRVKAQKIAFEKIRAFESSVNLFLDGKKLTILDGEAGPRHSSNVVIVPNGSTRRYPIQSLSSGERQVVSMLFSASRLAMNQGVFLVDEPELSLHIDWQRSILGELIKQAGERQIIACTHSVEVGAEHRDAVIWFDPEHTDGEHGETLPNDNYEETE